MCEKRARYPTFSLLESTCRITAGRRSQRDANVRIPLPPPWSPGHHSLTGSSAAYSCGMPTPPGFVGGGERRRETERERERDWQQASRPAGSRWMDGWMDGWMSHRGEGEESLFVASLEVPVLYSFVPPSFSLSLSVSFLFCFRLPFPEWTGIVVVVCVCVGGGGRVSSSFPC